MTKDENFQCFAEGSLAQWLGGELWGWSGVVFLPRLSAICWWARVDLSRENSSTWLHRTALKTSGKLPVKLAQCPVPGGFVNTASTVSTSTSTISRITCFQVFSSQKVHSVVSALYKLNAWVKIFVLKNPCIFNTFQKYKNGEEKPCTCHPLSHHPYLSASFLMMGTFLAL